MPEKNYIEVEVIFYPDGCLVPISFVWEDEKIKINKTSDPRLCSAQKM